MIRQQQLDAWFGKHWLAVVPAGERRERADAMRTDLKTAAESIMRYSDPHADQTRAINHLRYAWYFALTDLTNGVTG